MCSGISASAASHAPTSRRKGQPRILRIWQTTEWGEQHRMAVTARGLNVVYGDTQWNMADSGPDTAIRSSHCNLVNKAKQSRRSLPIKFCDEVSLVVYQWADYWCHPSCLRLFVRSVILWSSFLSPPSCVFCLTIECTASSSATGADAWWHSCDNCVIVASTTLASLWLLDSQVGRLTTL